MHWDKGHVYVGKCVKNKISRVIWHSRREVVSCRNRCQFVHVPCCGFGALSHFPSGTPWGCAAPPEDSGSEQLRWMQERLYRSKQWRAHDVSLVLSGRIWRWSGNKNIPWKSHLFGKKQAICLVENQTLCNMSRIKACVDCSWLLPTPVSLGHFREPGSETDLQFPADYLLRTPQILNPRLISD